MKRKNRTIRFVFAFLVIASLLMLVNPICGVCAEQKKKSLETYPTTPEGVVEAFVRAGFDGAANEVIGDVRLGLQYTTWEWYPGSDFFCVALKYKVTKWMVGPEKATVKVVYSVIAILAGYDNLEIERREEIEYYEVLKDKGLWKISSPAHIPCVSVDTAIRILEHGLVKYRDYSWRMEKIIENIKTLKKFLK